MASSENRGKNPIFLSIVLKQDLLEMKLSTRIIGTRIWLEENPQQIRERGFQQRISINMWAGIMGYRLIGPHVLPQHLNGEEYLNFLQNVLSDLLDDVPLLVWRDMWYLYDGTLAHKMLKIGDRW
jgi:hypothetical protein